MLVTPMVTAVLADSSAAADKRCPACGAQGLRPVLHGRDRLYRAPGRFAIAVCPACGSGTTLPAASDEDLARYYPGEYVAYQNVGSNPLLQRLSAAVRRWQSWIALQTPPLSLFRTAEAGYVLDVGCGRGDLGAALVERGWHVTGIEPSRAACEQARSRGLDARCGTLDTVELERNTYDVAVFRHSLEHMSDPVPNLAHVRSALRPGGRVVVSVPDFDSWYRRAFGSHWFHLDLPRHRIHFSRAGLERALVRAGLRTERVTKSTSTVGLAASVQYTIFGRCLFPHGLPFRIAVTACVAVFPLAWLVDRALNDGDGLHVVARSLE
jgi:SAM-dependent methyltransferase